jgi:hypothetical protein
VASTSRTAVLLLAGLAAACRADRATAPPLLAYRSGDAAIDALQRRLQPTLEANRKEFRGSLGSVQGFGAGDRYPQIWLRDSATLVPVTRYLYTRGYLTSWIEEHLACQQPDGGLYDWIAAGSASHFLEWAPRARDVFTAGSVVLSADKNTTEADQEASAIEAAWQAWRATGDDAWLRKDLRGRSVVERLGLALESVFERSYDPQLGLVVSALTADWGDVSPVGADQGAIYLDDATPRAAGLYTNALVHRALLRLAELRAAVGDASGGAALQDRARRLREAINRQLWQPERGFYRMHLPVKPSVPGFPDDADVFALGGNAVAALAGVADEAQASRLFQAAAERQRRYGVATIASALLPPYPAGVFRHPTMAQEWQYQNGGQWDWFAGRFLLAEFQRGAALQARVQLAAIAQRVERSGGFFEWNTREGEGRGSPRYAGSAAAIGDAVVQGLFGVELGRGRLALWIRLGEQSGSIELGQPCDGSRLSYRYEYDAAGRRASVAYDASVIPPGRLAVLLPDGVELAGASLDGRPVACAVERVGADRYAAVETDWKRHRLEITFRSPSR